MQHKGHRIRNKYRKCLLSNKLISSICLTLNNSLEIEWNAFPEQQWGEFERVTALLERIAKLR